MKVGSNPHDIQVTDRTTHEKHPSLSRKEFDQVYWPSRMNSHIYMAKVFVFSFRDSTFPKVSLLYKNLWFP